MAVCDDFFVKIFVNQFSLIFILGLTGVLVAHFRQLKQRGGARSINVSACILLTICTRWHFARCYYYICIRFKLLFVSYMIDPYLKKLFSGLHIKISLV